jgi:hypothetical protein
MKFYSHPNYRGQPNYYKKPFHKTRGFYVFLIIIALIISFVYFSINSGEEATYQGQKLTDQAEIPINAAKIVFVSGKVELKSADASWQEVGENYQAQTDDIIRTDKDSRAIVELPDKSLVRLSGNAEIKFLALGMADVIIEQKSGLAFHRVNSQSTAIYRVKNSATELTALGTGFNVLTSGPLTYLTVTESKVKVKISQGDDIVNMRTVEEGTKAEINPSLATEQMIKVEEVKMENLIKDDWFSWNLDHDRDKNFYLGIFEKAIKLVIIEPKENERTVESEKITIKGETDPAAKIFMAGKEIENNNGRFQTDFLLAPGKNEIEITAKKDKNLNKKTIVVNSTKQQEQIVLTGGLAEKNAVQLSWTTKNIGDFKEFKVLQSSAESPTYPNSPYHTAGKTVNSDEWTNLATGDYFFRVCALTQENKCLIYSNNLKITVGPGQPNTEAIQLKTTVKGNNVSLSWTVGSSLNSAEGFKSVIATIENPIYPGNSYHTLTSNQRNDTWKKLNPGTYHFRICLLKNNACAAYSNDSAATVSAASADGSISLTGSSGDSQINLYWTVENLTISKGFKVIIDESPVVVFPGKGHHFITSSSATSDTWLNLQSDKTYYFRVCQNLGAECGAYSNEVEIKFK